eukprot:g2307.t1
MSTDDSAAPQGNAAWGWQQITDPVSGNIYWWDPDTDETSWQAPPEMLDAEADADSQQLELAGTSDELEDDWVGRRFGDWVETIDDTSGETYYYNILTHETAWDCPAAAIVDEPSSTEALELDIDHGYGGSGGDNEGYTHEMGELSRLTALTSSSLHLHDGNESMGSSSADADAVQTSSPAKIAGSHETIHPAAASSRAKIDTDVPGRPPAAALCSGWLYKRDVQRGRNWRQRYFCLSGATISYYSSREMCAEARVPGHGAKGQFLLVPGTVVVTGAPSEQSGLPTDTSAGSNRIVPPSLPPPPRPIAKSTTSSSHQSQPSQAKQRQPVARTLNQTEAFKRKQRGRGRSPPLPPTGPAGGSAYLETGGHAAEQTRSRTSSLSGLASKASKVLGSAMRVRSGKALSGARLAEGSESAGASAGLPHHARYIFSIMSPTFDPTQEVARPRSRIALNRRMASAANAPLVLAVSSIEERDAWIEAIRAAAANFGSPSDWAGATDQDDMGRTIGGKDRVAQTSDSASMSEVSSCGGDSSSGAEVHTRNSVVPRVHGWLKASRGRVAVVDGRRLQRPVFSGGRKAKARKGDDSSAQLWKSAYYQLHTIAMLCYCDERRDSPARGAAGSAPEYDGDYAASAALAGAEGGTVGDVPLFAQLTTGEIASGGGLMLPHTIAAAAKASRRNTMNALIGGEGAISSATKAVLPADASFTAAPPSSRTLATGAPALLRCVVDIVDTVEVGGSTDNNIFAIRHTDIANAALSAELPLTYFLAPSALEKDRWLSALHTATSTGAIPPQMMLATERQMLWASTAGTQPGAAEEHLASWFAPPDDFIAMSVPATAAASAVASVDESAGDALSAIVGDVVYDDGDGAHVHDINLDILLGATIRRPTTRVNFAAATSHTIASAALAGQGETTSSGVADMETSLQAMASSAEWGIVKSVADHSPAAECGVRRGDALHAIVPAKLSDGDESMTKGIPLVLAPFDTAIDCARLALSNIVTAPTTVDGVAVQPHETCVQFVFRQPQRLAGWLWKRPRGYARMNKAEHTVMVLDKIGGMTWDMREKDLHVRKSAYR